MKLKKLSKSSLIFREIIEKNTRNNLKLSFLVTRALIRYSVRIFSLNFGGILLKQYLILYKIIFFKKKIYEKYILQINIFRIDCRILFADKKLDEYVKKRIEWSNFILSNSLSKEEKNAALQYLRIFNIFGYYNKKILASSVKTSIEKKNKDNFILKILMYIGFKFIKQTDVTNNYKNFFLKKIPDPIFFFIRIKKKMIIERVIRLFDYG